MATAIILHILAGLSREHSNFVLVAIRGVVSLALITFIGSITTDTLAQKTLHENIQVLLSDWPSDIRTAIKKFDLEPSLLEYVCCKRCFSLYDPHNYPYNGDFGCPPNCTFCETPTSDECVTQLLDANAKVARNPAAVFSISHSPHGLDSYLHDQACRASYGQPSVQLLVRCRTFGMAIPSGPSKVQTGNHTWRHKTINLIIG